MAFQKKTTASVEVVMGAAAASIKKGVSELKGALTALEALDNSLEEKQLLIAQKEEQIALLSVDFTEKKRAAQVQLELDMRQDQQKAVDAFLAANGLQSISKVELGSLANELAELKADFAKKLSAESAKAYGAAASDSKQKEALLQAQYEAKEAGNKAEITQLLSKVSFLESQASQWKAELADERKASIERAKAGSIGTLNVGQASGNGR